MSELDIFSFDDSPAPVYAGPIGLPREFEPNRLRILKYVLESSILAFTRFFHRIRENNRFILNRHHWLLAQALMDVYEGKTTRLIINVPPGYTKTMLAVISFIAWGLARNPRARFIHISYSDELAYENSVAIRDTIETDWYQALWPSEFKVDTQAKKRWKNKYGGGLLAVPSGGGITGFRAGRMESGFSGAIIIDDPLKPADAFSDAKRNTANNYFVNTFNSRLAHEDIPIIVIMQRIHEDDPSGFLLRGATGDLWDHLILPVDIPKHPDPYPAEYTHGIPIKHNLKPGPLWEYKHNRKEIDKLKTSPKTQYTFSSQYDQNPTTIGGSLFKTEWWRYYEAYDPISNTIVIEPGNVVSLQYKNIYADTAMKKEARHDWSVFQLWGYAQGKIFLLDQSRGKWEAPELKKEFIAFCDKHEFIRGVNTMGTRFRRVEDKSSGIGLIQEINKEKGKGYISGIPRDKDKVSRARSGAPSIAEGKVYLPQASIWLAEYILEFQKFSAEMSHRHDDQIDPTLDAINEMLIDISTLNYATAVR